MKSTIAWSLAGLNLLLAAILIARVMPETTAHAQVRRPSDYIMIPGAAQGVPNTVIYVVDTTNGGLSCMVYDENRKRVDTLPSIDLNRFFAVNAPGPDNNPNAARGGTRR